MSWKEGKNEQLVLAKSETKKTRQEAVTEEGVDKFIAANARYLQAYLGKYSRSTGEEIDIHFAMLTRPDIFPVSTADSQKDRAALQHVWLPKYREKLMDVYGDYRTLLVAKVTINGRVLPVQRVLSKATRAELTKLRDLLVRRRDTYLKIVKTLNAR